MPYKFLENVAIADVCIEATGKTQEEMFEQAGLATTSVMVDLKTLKAAEKMAIKLEAENLDKLLLDFLEELIFIKDTKGLLFCKFNTKIITGKLLKLEAECIGDKINNKKQTLLADIKAVTLHMFEIKKKNGNYYCRFVLDI